MLSAIFFLAFTMTLMPGCGESKPANGTQASPVNDEEAKAQNAAMKDAMKSKMKPSPKKK